MRILQITRQSETIGGIGTYVRSLTADLSALGQDCVVLSPDQVDRPGDRTSRYVHVDELGLRPGASPFIGPVMALVDSLEPDVVLVHHMADVALVDGLQARRVPVAEVVHGFACASNKLFRRRDRVCTHAVGPRCLWDWYAGPCGSSPDPRHNLAEHRQAVAHLDALRRLRRVFVLSEFMRDYLAGEGIPPERVRVVHWTPSTTAADPSPTAPSRVPGRRVLFVGRLVYAKGAQYLLAALARLDPTFSLRIAGTGWYQRELEAQCARLGIADRVAFLGDVDPSGVADEYRRADVVVVPSIWPEPLSLVPAEAAGHGCRVVVSAVGGLPEWADRGVPVRTCPPADAAGLARAVANACDAPGQPAASAPAGRPASPLAHAADLLGELEQLCAGPAADAGRVSGRPPPGPPGPAAG